VERLVCIAALTEEEVSLSRLRAAAEPQRQPRQHNDRDAPD
jgi:hypothetical protein